MSAFERGDMVEAIRTGSASLWVSITAIIITLICIIVILALIANNSLRLNDYY